MILFHGRYSSRRFMWAICPTWVNDDGISSGPSGKIALRISSKTICFQSLDTFLSKLTDDEKENLGNKALPITPFSLQNEGNLKGKCIFGEGLIFPDFTVQSIPAVQCSYLISTSCVTRPRPSLRTNALDDSERPSRSWSLISRKWYLSGAISRQW